MQPKFTRRSLVYFFSRLSMLTLVMALTTLTSTAQKTAKPAPKQVTADHKARYEQKLLIEKFGRAAAYPKAPVSATNDVGIARPAQSGNNIVARTEAVCATFTGSLAAGDPTMAGRLNRNGVQGVCPGPKPFAGTLAANTYYDTYTWTNTSGLAQCATFTLSTTDAASNIEFGVYNGSFNPADLSINFFTDPGLSSGTPPTNTVCSANISAGQTLVFVVFSPNALGTATNYTLTVDMPICASAPCAGTPTPGNTLSTVSTVCAGINFTLSLQNTTAGSGVTYQWQVSTTGVGGTYSNIAGATGSTLTTTQSVASCYRCIVTCGSPGGGSGTSTPVCVALTPPSGCYCTPPATDCTDDDVILRVRLSTLDNASTCGTGPPAGYSNFTALPAPVVYAGAPNPLTVDVPTTFTEQVAAWIDYNQNGNFEASEYTNLGSNGAGGTIVGNINIPTTALTGTTRMRVRVRFATVLGSGDACLGYTFGETEDYNVNIQPCVPITITGSPASASISCGSNATFAVTTTGSLPVYRWEYRPNAAAAWQFVPNAAPYSGVNTATLTITNASAALSGYQYRATVIGGCSATDFSAAATLTVNPLVPVVNPSSATICVGTVQQLTLTNTTGNADLISEGFGAVPPAGWFTQNNSTPVGTTGWFQGNTAVFPAQSGAPDSYIGANFNNVTGANTISNWLVTPAVPIKNGDVFTFWTRTITGPTFPDRLEVRLNTTNTTNVGATNVSVGDFTTLLLTVNPGLTTAGYPDVWTQYTVTVSGLGAPVAAGRFAFRYFVTNGGPAGANSDYIGIDNVTFTSVGGPAQGVWGGPAGTMWTNAAANVAYTGTPATTIWVTPSVTSNYTVFYNTLTPCTSSTTTVPVAVVNPAVIATSPVNRTVCDGGSTTFTVSATGGPLTYQWQRSVDGGLTYANIAGATASTLSVSGITVSMSGYRYRCVVSAAPCAGSATSGAAILTVNALPVVTISSPDLLITPGQTTTITATSTPAAATVNSWSWTLNGSSITGTTNTQVVGVDGFGTYQARVTDVNGCVNTSNSLTIGAEASDRLWIYPNPSTGAFQVRLYYSGPVTERRVVSIFNAIGQLVGQKEFTLDNVVSPYLRMDFNLGNLSAGTYVVKVHNVFTNKVTSGLVVIQHD